MIRDMISGIIKFISIGNVRWIEFPAETKPRIYFSNHSSHLDAFVLWAALPRQIRTQTRVVAAKEYWEKTGLRRLVSHKIFNPVLVDRNHISCHDIENHPINKIVDVLDKDNSIVIFPEGTRSEKDGIQPFKSGLYHLCKKRPNIELIPVYLENLNRILPKGEVLFVPVIGSVTFGKPVMFDRKESKTEFLERTREAIIELGES